MQAATRLRYHAGQGLLWIVLAGALVLPCWIGNLAAYITAIAGILGGLVMFSRERFSQALSERGVQAFAAAFLLLAIALSLSAQSVHDLLTWFDFIFLLISLPLAMLCLRYARAGNILVFSLLALGGAAIAFLVAAWDVYHLGLSRAEGLYSYATLFAPIAVLLGFLAPAALFTSKAGIWRLVLLAGPALGVAAGVIAGTRASLVIAAMLTIVVLAYAVVRRNTWVLVTTLTAVAGLGLVVALFGEAFGLHRALTALSVTTDVLTTGDTLDASVDYRLGFWAAGVEAFFDSPIYGHGWWRRFSAAAPYMSDAVSGPYLGAPNAHLHNDIINFAVAAGLIGVIAYLVALAAPVIWAIASPRDEQYSARVYGASILSIGFLAMGTTNTMFLSEASKAALCFITPILMTFCRDRPPTTV